jgi:hypothetical protein
VRSLALSAAAAAAASQPLLSFAAASAAHLPLAMVNVDFASPSLVLGTALIGCGIALLQTRNLQRRVSRDADIVVAAMVSIVGSTLIFQGWRLDPLLLLCQVRRQLQRGGSHGLAVMAGRERGVACSSCTHARGARRRSERSHTTPGHASPQPIFNQRGAARRRRYPATPTRNSHACPSARSPPRRQALTTSVAVWYGLEAFKLRAQVQDEEVSSYHGLRDERSADAPMRMGRRMHSAWVQCETRTRSLATLLHKGSIWHVDY